MCGVTGFFLTNDNKGGDFLKREIKKMNNSLSHRGPNNDDLWFDENEKIYLGHRRLSIMIYLKKLINQ